LAGNIQRADFWRRKGPRPYRTAHRLRLVHFGSAFFIYAIASTPDYADVDGYDPDVVYENRLDIPVRVFMDGYYEASLGPGESRSDSYFFCGRGCLLEATDREGGSSSAGT
jgi:hypothetical protein